MSALIHATRPQLATLLERTRVRLSPEAQAQVDGHVTQAEKLLEDVFVDLTLWSLTGSTELWARAADVADLMEIGANKMPERVAAAVQRGELSPPDVRRGVTDSDVTHSITPSTGNCLTDSPRGVMMLSLRAIRRLVMTCDGDRGVRFRDGLDRALEFASEAERTIMALLLAAEDRPDARLDRIEAAVGRLVESMAPAEAVWVQGPSELTVKPTVLPPGFVFTLTTVADALVTSRHKAEARLRAVDLWDNPTYRQSAYKRNRLGTLQAVHAFHRSVVLELLFRERGPLLMASAGGDE